MKEELQKLAEEFQAFLIEKPSDEPAELLERMGQMEIVIARAGHCLALAKKLQDEYISTAIINALERQIEEKLSPSTINIYIKSIAKDYNYLVNSFERINSSAVHQHDGLRTRLSYFKTLLNA
jgi:hypothetical protein